MSRRHCRQIQHGGNVPKYKLKGHEKCQGRSEQSTQIHRSPIHDDQLAVDFGFALPLVGCGVSDVQSLEVEALEHAPDVRLIS